MNEKESSELLERINELEGMVENLRDLAAHAYIFCGVHDAPEKWLDVMFAGANGDDFTTEGLLPYTPPADPLVEVDEETVKRFKSAYEMAREADDTQDVALCDGLKAAIATSQARPDGGAVLHLQIVDGIKREWAVSSQDGLWNLPAGKHLLYTHPAPAPDNEAFRGLDSAGRPIYGNRPTVTTTTADNTAPAPDVARLVELLNAIDADVLAAEQIGERVTHDDIRTCVSQLRAAAQQEKE